MVSRLNNCRKESSKDIASAVMLTGGGSSMKGLHTRLNRELIVMSKGVWFDFRLFLYVGSEISSST